MINPIHRYKIVTPGNLPAKNLSCAPCIDQLSRVGRTYEFQPATVMDYVCHPTWVMRDVILPHAPHEHGGGKVALDLDEPASAVATGFKRMGLPVWFSLPVLIGGIYYAWEGADEAYETLTHWWRNRAKHNAFIAEVATPGPAVYGAASQVYKGAAVKNAAVMKSILKQAKHEDDRRFALALPTFLGCIGMAGSLLFSEALIGGLFQNCAPLADACMQFAAPAMCMFAAGMVCVAAYDQFKVAYEALGLSRGKNLLINYKKSGKPQDLLVQGISDAQKQLWLRTASNFSNMVLATCMGVGVWAISAGALAGLWYMLPGAVGLVVSQWARAKYVNYGKPFEALNDTVQLGGKRAISIEMQHLQAHLDAIDEMVQKSSHGELASVRLKSFWRATTQTNIRFAQKLKAVVDVKSKSALGKTALSSLDRQIGRASKLIHWLNIGDEHLPPSADVILALVQVLAINGVDRDFVLALAQDPQFDTALSRLSEGGVQKINEADIVRILDADPTKYEAICDIGLKIIASEARNVISRQRRALIALFTRRVGLS